MVPIALSPPPSLSTPSSTSVSRKLSTTSLQSLADRITVSSNRSNVEVLKEASPPRHAKVKLDARHYKKPHFILQLVDIIRILHVPSWLVAAQIPLEDIIIHKVSGALTNAVFFVSCPTVSSVSTLLLRIYGSSSDSLISRPKELRILHILSSQYKIGPRLYGTFENGRIEEYFDSVPLTAADIRDPQISRWIGARMAELHSVDIDKVDSTSEEKVFGIATHIKSWVASAKEVLRLPSVSDSTRQELDLSRFKDEWNRYLAWATREGRGLGSKRVFAHNDAQYGNLLRLKDSREDIEEHRQIIVVDFEYAGPNPAAYDIANHFQEWTADYYSQTPHLLNPSRYPTLEERCNFYTSYLRHACMLAEVPIIDENKLAKLVKDLEWDVRIWSAASHAGWAIWGIVQAKEDLESNNADAEFDYIQYAKGRMASFRELIQALRI